MSRRVTYPGWPGGFSRRPPRVASGLRDILMSTGDRNHSTGERMTQLLRESDRNARHFPRRGLLVAFLCLVFSSLLAQAPQQDSEKQQRGEEARDYYKKWLQEDVVYIITQEEKDVFERLATPEEKESFIEQFWRRRDDDPTTHENTFKLEHYRRIAYANERFSSGYPGWLTDRGRIYITLGPPAQIENHSAGETYDRPLYEGGGMTSTHPYQVWRYRHIDGVGDNVVLEFVDRTLSGEYRLALHPDEKDALLNLDAGGPTLLEQLEMARKADRGTSQQELGYEREQDSPFRRLETYAKVLTPQQIRYTDLKEVVDTNVQYADLPFRTRNEYIHLNQDQVLLLVSIQVDNQNVSFKSEEGAHAARLGVYGVVTSITKRIIFEFDDDIESRFAGQSLDAALSQSSVYQKVIPVDRKMRSKITLVVKDLNSQKIGIEERVISPPAFGPEGLASSSLVLAESIRSVSPSDEMFVIGDLKVRPNLAREFFSRNPLGIYLQIHNAEIDQATGKPALAVKYRILKGDEVMSETVDGDGQSIQFYSNYRVVLVKGLSLKNLEAGTYKIQVSALDRISGEDLTVEDQFRVVESPSHGE